MHKPWGRAVAMARWESLSRSLMELETNSPVSMAAKGK